MIKDEEQTTPSRMCRLLHISRSEYYRNIKGLKDYIPRQRGASEKASNTFVERAVALAGEHWCYGHRKIHALLLREGFHASRYQVYRLLKRENLCLASTWRQDLRERSKALKEYLVKPQKPLELLQADITHIPIEGYGTYYVIDVIDYHTKYVLASIFSDRHGTDDLIRGCEEACMEAKRLGLVLPTDGDKIKLLTDNGPAMISRHFRQYIGSSPFRHLRTKNHHPQTNGCIERYHQTLKYEEVWGAMYENPMIAKERIDAFRKYYNEQRIHQALGYKTPMEMIQEYKTQITYQQAV
jgi:putative transposase